MDADIQVEPEHYASLNYDRKERFLSYWHQISEVVERNPDDLLEVGIGNGFVHRYLRNFGLEVHTLDFDERLGPDTVGSVLELPFEDNQFDMACCFESLEHLPWDDFSTAVRELTRVARRWVLLSLPDVTPYMRTEFEVSRKNLVKIITDLPNPNPDEHEWDGQHYWELGAKGFPVGRIIAAMEAEGLKVENNFRIFENPYHRFLSARIV